MKYNKCYFFAFLLTLLTCYMAQATQVLDPEDSKDEKSLIIPCLPIENQLSENLVPELSASQVSSKKSSDIIQSSRDSDSVHLYDLPNNLLPKILGYVGIVELRAVDNLFYYYVTGESMEEGIKAKGMSKCTHFRGISGEKNYAYNFDTKTLYFKDEQGKDFIKSLAIEQIPTWFWQRWIKEVKNISIEQIECLKGTNIHTLNVNPKNWLNLFFNLCVCNNGVEKNNNLSSLCISLKDTNVLILNLYNTGIYRNNFFLIKDLKYKNIKIFIFDRKI